MDKLLCYQEIVKLYLERASLKERFEAFKVIVQTSPLSSSVKDSLINQYKTQMLQLEPFYQAVEDSFYNHIAETDT